MAGETGGLAAFFAPATVAIIGASRSASKVGGAVLANLRAAGFPGRVVPVNRRAEAAQGLDAVPSLEDVVGPVDLAVIAVPAPEVLPALRACEARGVAGAVVISAGFRETGAEGWAREAELRAWLRGRRLRVLGPNCLGWIRPAARLNLTFAPGMPLAGSIAFVSHSGALAVAILDWSRERRMGFSLFASLGNQADLTETDVLAAVADDPETRVVVAYLEGVTDGRALFRALRQVAASKPVIVLKAGRTAEGARAVSSHTGALAGSDEAFDAAIRQAGAVRARTMEELFDLARALDAQPAPRGRRLLVVTNGGGLGVVATDAAREAGFEVAPLAEAVRERLRAVLPSTASVVNPVDLVGDADERRFGRALRALEATEGIDAALVLLTVQYATDSATVARAIVGATAGWRVPVTAAFVGGARVAAGAVALEEARIPCYPFPERAVTALRGMTAVTEARAAAARPTPCLPAAPPEAAVLLAALAARGGGRLGLPDLAPLLAAYGVPVAESVLAGNVEDAAAAATRLGCPVALKLMSPDIPHKTDVGGVVLGLGSPGEVRRAAREVLARARAAHPEAVVQGLLVQRMAAPGRELLVGVVRDPQFGPLVVVGSGGIHVEVLRDTTTRLAPVGADEALAMLDELRLAPLLRGVRGEAPVDRAAIAEVVSRLSRLGADAPGLAEVELNPLIGGPAGSVAVDARGTFTIGTTTG